MSQNSQPKKIMIQNRKNKNTEKGLASDNRNKTITNINKSSSNIQQAVEGTATPIHERAQTTNINKSSSNIQQAVEGTATPIHEQTQTTNINKNSSNTQQPSAAPSHERAQSVKERYKNLRLPDSSNTQPPSAAPSHERVQSVKERYKNLRLPVRYQTNEPTRDDDDASTENRRLSQEVSDLRAKCLQLERRNNELTKHTAVVATEIARLREDNEFLAGVNAEFGSENDDLKEEVNELKTKLEQYQIRSSSESLDFIDVPEERLAKRFKSDGSKKVKKTVHYAENQPKEEQEEQREKEARIEMKMIFKTIKPNDNLDDNETFNSPKNVEIRSRLIPELRRAIFPNYKPSVAQLTNWLSALHKSRRSQTQLKKSGKSDEDSRRVHNNSRVQNKKLRRIKAAKDLYRKSDERIIGYEKRQLLKMLANRSYHSPEISESDEENPDKTIVCVYDYSWRSQELKNLLRNVIDSHSADIQTAKLQRPRQYDDEVQHFDRMHPEDAPQWSYVEQEDFIYDTEIDSRSGFDEDEDYGEETEEVLIDSQKSGAGDDLAE
ncbi:hypothetical protein GLOIN_2v1840618 [Rhizophagus irregularis DAOM 181602=DAOM 197198]|nr:hypothetical protein GLOIN_2v1840618 [Rhizophagus irregularis DAOM 181602=DAOM 197198]